jgi:hypothetical protein
MEHNKAAKADGMPIEFYQTCWDILRMILWSFFMIYIRGNWLSAD